MPSVPACKMDIVTPQRPVETGRRWLQREAQQRFKTREIWMEKCNYKASRVCGIVLSPSSCSELLMGNIPISSASPLGFINDTGDTGRRSDLKDSGMTQTALGASHASSS